MAAKDAIQIGRLIHDLGLNYDESPIQIAEDNSAAIAQAAGGIRAVRKAKYYEFVYDSFRSLWFRKQLSSFIVRLTFSWQTYSPSHCFRIATLL